MRIKSSVISDIRQDIIDKKLSAIQNAYHLSEGWQEMAAAPGQI